MGDVAVGTCSWTDKTMIERWYPQGVSSAEARLRYYAARYDTVEVDSTFYGLPQAAYAQNWVERTPEHFTFHIKAYGMMTRHDVDERSLHPDLRDYRYELSDRGRVHRPEQAMVERSFEIFAEELQPLVAGGKMGGVLMQLPPYITARYPDKTHETLRYLEWAQEMLAQGLPDTPMLVEFRHPSWVVGDQLSETMRFLSEHDMAYVSVDAPQFPERSTMPPVTAATAPWAYVRMHGRNRETYFARVPSAAERFDYLYTSDELAEWAGPISELAEQTERTWVMFNNCKYDYAPRNARDMAEILGDLIAPREGGAATGEPAAAAEGGGAPGDASSGAEESQPGSDQLGLDI
jgi:uncharacterized protein YecE (DUF72 family)